MWMNTEIEQSFYKNTPKDQLKLFFDFQKNHAYKNIVYNDKTEKYIACGNGEKTLIFLYGALVRPDMWFYPILKLEDKFRIIAPLFPTQGMGAQEAIDFVRFILMKENIFKAIFIGYSYGGGVAQYFAEKYPELVETLVLSHTGLLRRENAKTEITRMYNIIKIFPFFLFQMLLKSRTPYYPSSEWNEFHKAYFMEIASKITKSMFLEKLRNDLKFVEETEYIPLNKREWNGKTILLGTRSDKDAFKYFDKFRKLYPDLKSYIFEEEGGHHMIFLFPKKYTEILTGYLGIK